jgi:hypothetical protein
MSKYILPDILQYILNDYLDHQDIEIYNRVFDFKFDIKKYMKIIKGNDRVLLFLHIKQTFLDGQLVKEECMRKSGEKYYEHNYKYGKFNGKCTLYDSVGHTITEERIYENGKIISSTKKYKNSDNCCIIS